MYHLTRTAHFAMGPRDGSYEPTGGKAGPTRRSSCLAPARSSSSSGGRAASQCQGGGREGGWDMEGGGGEVRDGMGEESQEAGVET